jgi:hypothetical protein
MPESITSKYPASPPPDVLCGTGVGSAFDPEVTDGFTSMMDDPADMWSLDRASTSESISFVELRPDDLDERPEDREDTDEPSGLSARGMMKENRLPSPTVDAGVATLDGVASQ